MGSDNAFGRAVSQISATAINPNVDPARNRAKLIFMEEPGLIADAQSRAETEATVREGESLQVEVVLQGWLRPDGQLWEAGKIVALKAPSVLPFDGAIRMAIQSLAFTQSSDGTRTTLHLVKPSALRRPFSNGSGTLAPDAFKTDPAPAQPD